MPNSSEISSPVLTKRRLGLAGVAAVVSCVACCTMPLLAAAGLGSGGIAVLSSVFSPGNELMVGGGFFVLALGALVIRVRLKRSEASACGCENSCGASAEPIACTLAGREQQLKRADEFREAFTHLERTEPIAGGFRWYFRADAAVEARLRELASREHACCKFFDFRIARQGRALVWETRAAQEAAAVLEEFKRLPETLDSAPSLDAMTRALGDAGLKFGESAG